jgi:hypothetical protein
MSSILERRYSLDNIYELHGSIYPFLNFAKVVRSGELNAFSANPGLNANLGTQSEAI